MKHLAPVGRMAGISHTSSDRGMSCFQYGCGSKNRYQNGTLVSGNMYQNLRNPSSHTHMALAYPQAFCGPNLLGKREAPETLAPLGQRMVSSAIMKSNTGAWKAKAVLLGKTPNVHFHRATVPMVNVIILGRKWALRAPLSRAEQNTDRKPEVRILQGTVYRIIILDHGCAR